MPQTGVQLYSGMKDSVLAMQQTIGSPINTALAPEYEADTIVNFPSAWSKTLTEIPGTGVVGATYDVEISNGYDYLFKQGLLKEGDTVGHIYFEGEYGANGLAGSKAVAEEKGLKIIEAQIKSTDQDMSAQVTQFKAAGVKAIALTVAPGQTASVAAVAEAQGLDVPILGNNPVFAPGLLAGPTANWLKTHLYVASPVSSFDEHADLLKAYQEAYPDVTPSLGVLVGTGMATLMNQVLDAACDNGDLTRAGVLDGLQGPEGRRHRRPRRPDPGLRERQVAQPGELRAPAGRRSRWGEAPAGRDRGRVRGEDRRLTPGTAHGRRLLPHGEGRRSAVYSRPAPGATGSRRSAGRPVTTAASQRRRGRGGARDHRHQERDGEADDRRWRGRGPSARRAGWAPRAGR